MRVIKIGTKLGDVELTNIDDMESVIGASDFSEETPFGLWYNHIVLVCRKNGMLQGLEPNENLFPFFFVGECFLAHHDFRNFSDLTDNDLTFVKQWLKGLDNGELYEVNI